MPGTTRDRLKSRASKVGEVLSLNALGAGQANSQVVVAGCEVTKGGTSDRQILLSAGTIVLAQNVVNVAAVGATSLTGAGTTAGQWRKVAVTVDALGALGLVIGDVAASQAAAKLPSLPTDKITVAVIELPENFTVGTTSLTDAMISNYSMPGGSLAAFYNVPTP